MTVLQAASDTEGLVAIDALGTAGVYRSRNPEVITDTAGVPVAALSLVPPLYVTRTIGAQRKVRPLPIAQRRAALYKTAEIFTNSLTAGLDFDHYVQLASRVSGLPIAVTRAGAQGVADALETATDAVWHARPAGAVFDWREERTRWGCAVWARRGEVFAIHASGNRRESTVGAVARVAVNLRGVNTQDIGRGDTVRTPGAWLDTTEIDVALRSAGELHRQLVLHIGSAAVPGTSGHWGRRARGCG